MASQLELLKKTLARLDPEGGSVNPHILGLRMQIARYEKPRAENPVGNESRWSAGMRGPPTPVTPKK